MPLTVSSMLMNQQYGTIRKKGRENSKNCRWGTLESDEVTSVVYERAVVKMGKCLTCWIHEMTTNYKRHNALYYCEAERQRNLQSHPDSGKCETHLSWCWSAHTFQKEIGHDTVNLEGNAESRGRRLWEKLIKILSVIVLLSVIQKQSYMEE